MAMRSKVFTYQAELQWQGGRTATVASGDRPELTVAPPPDFPGGETDRWSPEHLFLAALESCTMLSFLAHCEHYGPRGRGLLGGRDRVDRAA